MRRKRIHAVLTAALLLTIFLSGCAYYNTYYNAKRKFAEAERDSRNQSAQQQPAPPQTPAMPARPGTPQPPRQQGQGIPSADKYRKVVETCSKLLEFYPKSRWVDDALLLMGKAYYRLRDYPRAERKFTELLTLFPQSKHAAEALIWKAKVLADDGEAAAATEFLTNNLSKLQSGSDRAEAHRLLGTLYSQQERWVDAADQFKQALAHKLNRDERATVQMRYGEVCLAQEDYATARDAFTRTARLSRDAGQTYRASILRARCEIALGNTVQAEEILRQLARSRAFAEYADDIALELAHLALRSGRIDDAIAAYQKFAAEHTNGELRGTAFYRLALIQRDKRANLTLSKALLDSALQSGAAGAIADSARLALDQISKGLLALDKIATLEQQLLNPGAPPIQQAMPDSSKDDAGDVSPPPVPAPTDTTGSGGTAEPESEGVDAEGMESEGSQLTGNMPDDSLDQTRRERMSPAALAADSILRALQARDSLSRAADTTATATLPDSITMDAAPDSAAGGQERAPSQPDQRTTIRRQLQLAYLHAAEFYNYSLTDRDSALYYYRLAAADSSEPHVYWKANLYLGQAAQAADEGQAEAAARYFRIVVSADSVPADAANLARKALGLPLIEAAVPPQAAALQRIESLQLAEAVSVDSLVQGYAVVADMDTTTNEAKIAMFAMAHLLEYDKAQFAAAKSVYQRIANAFPDSAFVTWINRKLEPPDSVSIFETADSLMMAIRNPPEIVIELEPEGGDWPPPEESLRGRRFR